jgi:hypothetical protein
VVIFIIYIEIFRRIMAEEIWKDVVGYEEYFQVSNLGNIFSKRTRKILITPLSKTGYPLLSTKFGGRKGKYKTIKVHRMVAEAFISNPDNKPFVNHVDGNKNNNVVTNLEWVTAKENSVHAVETGLHKPLRGMKHGSSKLTDDNVNYIRENYKPRCSVNGSRALGRKFGVDHQTILCIIERKTWKHLL